MLDEREKQEILDELEERIDRKYKGILTGEDVQSILREPREKWFRDENDSGYKSLMTQAFNNSIVAWAVWEQIRRLTCRVCGKSYVRQLTEDDNADMVAEKICALVYALAIKHRGTDTDAG